MTALVTENLAHLALAPDGVKRLRELILDLAVRGKLVSQSPNDAPAKVLQVQLAAEKQQLVGRRRRLPRENELRQSHPGNQPEPFRLPPGWEWTTLGTIASDIQYGFTASADKHSSGYRLLRITDIQDDRVDWDSVPGCAISSEEAKAYELKDGDILIARTGGTIGKSFLVRDIPAPAVFASYLIRVGRLASACPEFTKVFLGSRHYWAQLYAHSMGTGQPNVNGTALTGLTFPLPPIAEQHRIVAKVDELMALCDRLEARQQDAESTHAQLVQVLLDSLTQARDAGEFRTSWQRLAEHFGVLFITEKAVENLVSSLYQIAVSGRLVEQNTLDGNAADVMKVISSDRRKSSGKGCTKTVLKSNQIDTKDPRFQLPSQWVWCRLGDMAITQTGTTPNKNDPSHYGDDVPFIKPANILSSRIDYSGERLSKSGAAASGRMAPAGSLLMVCIGTIGKCNIIDRVCSFNQQINSATLLAGDPHFFLIVMQSPYFQKLAWDNSSSTTISIINKGRWESLPVPFPPVEEQRRIVAKVDELLHLCYQLKAGIAAGRAKHAQLAEALVKQTVTI